MAVLLARGKRSLVAWVERQRNPGCGGAVGKAAPALRMRLHAGYENALEHGHSLSLIRATRREPSGWVYFPPTILKIYDRYDSSWPPVGVVRLTKSKILPSFSP
jgi:hypothetical protein